MAGLYLARRLAEQGHEVEVFDRKHKIEGKACSTLVSERIYKFVPELKSLEENKIAFCKINFPRKTVTLKFNPLFFCLPREAAQETLAHLALNFGAKINLGKALESKDIATINQNFDRIIGCDGSLSPTRKWLGLSAPILSMGIQIFVPEKDDSDVVDTWIAKHGFLWRIPRGETVEYGIMANPKFAREEFETFCRERKIDSVKCEMKAALIPSGLRLPENDRVTLCGDAAGMTKPWSGGGIVWGFTAADMLIKHFPDFKAYRKEAMKFFGFQIFAGRLANGAVYFTGQNFPFLLPDQVTYDNDFLSLNILKFGGVG